MRVQNDSGGRRTRYAVLLRVTKREASLGSGSKVLANFYRSLTLKGSYNTSLNNKRGANLPQSSPRSGRKAPRGRQRRDGARARGAPGLGAFPPPRLVGEPLEPRNPIGNGDRRDAARRRVDVGEDQVRSITFHQLDQTRCGDFR